jgi:hypothetical protein
VVGDRHETVAPPMVGVDDGGRRTVAIAVGGVGAGDWESGAREDRSGGSMSSGSAQSAHPETLPI